MNGLSTKIRTVAKVAAAVLFAKVMANILYEYRWYLPPDFERSAFLIGRRESFVGIYSAAFYAHLVAGPLALVLGGFQMVSGGNQDQVGLHRYSGRLQMILISVVTISGLIMARHAFAGPVATWGFASLSLATTLTAIATAHFAINGYVPSHRRWATRCFILLCSPLLLRLVAGFTIVTHTESPWTYRLNAWLSWIVPLTMYEVWCRWSTMNLGSAMIRLTPQRVNK